MGWCWAAVRLLCHVLGIVLAAAVSLPVTLVIFIPGVVIQAVLFSPVLFLAGVWTAAVTPHLTILTRVCAVLLISWVPALLWAPVTIVCAVAGAIIAIPVAVAGGLAAPHRIYTRRRCNCVVQRLHDEASQQNPCQWVMIPGITPVALAVHGLNRYYKACIAVLQELRSWQLKNDTVLVVQPGFDDGVRHGYFCCIPFVTIMQSLIGALVLPPTVLILVILIKTVPVMLTFPSFAFAMVVVHLDSVGAGVATLAWSIFVVPLVVLPVYILVPAVTLPFLGLTVPFDTMKHNGTLPPVAYFVACFGTLWDWLEFWDKKTNSIIFQVEKPTPRLFSDGVECFGCGCRCCRRIVDVQNRWRAACADRRAGWVVAASRHFDSRNQGEWEWRMEEGAGEAVLVEDECDAPLVAEVEIPLDLDAVAHRSPRPRPAPVQVSRSRLARDRVARGLVQEVAAAVDELPVTFYSPPCPAITAAALRRLLVLRLARKGRAGFVELTGEGVLLGPANAPKALLDLTSNVLRPSALLLHTEQLRRTLLTMMPSAMEMNSLCRACLRDNPPNHPPPGVSSARWSMWLEALGLAVCAASDPFLINVSDKQVFTRALQEARKARVRVRRDHLEEMRKSASKPGRAKVSQPDVSGAEGDPLCVAVLGCDPRITGRFALFGKAQGRPQWRRLSAAPVPGRGTWDATFIRAEESGEWKVLAEAGTDGEELLARLPPGGPRNPPHRVSGWRWRTHPDGKPTRVCVAASHWREAGDGCSPAEFLREAEKASASSLVQPGCLRVRKRGGTWQPATFGTSALFASKGAAAVQADEDAVLQVWTEGDEVCCSDGSELVDIQWSCTDLRPLRSNVEGWVLRSTETTHRVDEVIEGSAADRAGIKPGYAVRELRHPRVGDLPKAAALGLPAGSQADGADASRARATCCVNCCRKRQLAEKERTAPTGGKPADEEAPPENDHEPVPQQSPPRSPTLSDWWPRQGARGLLSAELIERLQGNWVDSQGHSWYVRERRVWERLRDGTCGTAELAEAPDGRGVVLRAPGAEDVDLHSVAADRVWWGDDDCWKRAGDSEAPSSPRSGDGAMSAARSPASLRSATATESTRVNSV
eukprot:TRINITY_DN38702_c0_g1_i1.p1 TRINITY_DN38702_c0_g1~~TRINITY_DN38702_c0_g1_i1.p1  ORF type:complete len:1102 (+),score=179.34 TRINITY_DN38702_c0_g1_i1:72-3377(+)